MTSQTTLHSSLHEPLLNPNSQNQNSTPDLLQHTCNEVETSPSTKRGAGGGLDNTTIFLQNSKAADNRAIAILGMNIFALGNAATSAFFKQLQSEGVSVLEFTFLRNAFNLVGALALCAIYQIGPLRNFPRSQSKTMVARAFFGQSSYGLFLLSLALNPLIIQMVIFQTNPFWAAILGYFVNKEPIMCIEYIAMVVCLAGVVFIAMSKEQSMSLNDTNDLVGNSSEVESGKSSILGIGMIFGVSWLFAACNVINRKLKGMHFAIVLFYHALCGIFITVIIIVLEKVITGNPFRIYTANQYLIMLLCCCFDFLCVNAQTLAFQNDTSGFVSLVGYVGILYAFLTDYFIFQEQLGWFAIIGASIILVVTLSVSFLKIKESNRLKRLDEQNQQFSIGRFQKNQQIQ